MRLWMKRAACLDYSLEIGFLALPEAEQLAICGTCTVRDECRIYAAEIRATETVYGGLRGSKLPLRLR